MNTSEFRQLRAHVDELVHAQEEEQVDPALQHLPEIPRMTQVSQHK
jgi:NitT/TauT family transport system ATP-binding protein